MFPSAIFESIDLIWRSRMDEDGGVTCFRVAEVEFRRMALYVLLFTSRTIQK